MVMKKYFYLLFILTLFSCQEVDIDKLVESMASTNILESETIGFGGASEKYKNFLILRKNASKDKLIELIEHENASIVAYACYALIDNKMIAPSTLFEKYLKKDKSVQESSGCIMVNNFMSSIIYHWYRKDRFKFSDSDDYSYSINDSDELLTMDSLLLFHESPDEILMHSVFENRIYPKEYNTIIEIWALKKKNFEAIKYVFKNLRKGNEEKIQISLRNLLQKSRHYGLPKNEIIDMIKALN